jgi:hypothetical protein
MVEQIEISGKTFAIIIPADYEKEGIEFHSDPKDSLQIGSMMWRSGHHIQGHKHLSHPRTVEFSNEAIFITKGKVKINFLNDSGKTLLSRILETGDVVLLLDGGHSFDIIEDARMIEVKQGPYVGESDKLRYEVK